MNKANLQQIFSHYLEKFEYITDKNSNDENYKWFICKKFRKLMDEALASETESFASALYKAKAVTAKTAGTGRSETEQPAAIAL